MPLSPPAGDPAPSDRSLPGAALDRFGQGAFGLYVHVPFCRVRCGYCDFNTYIASELDGEPGATPDSYVDVLLSELTMAREVLGAAARPVDTIFVGGGTPTVLPASELVRVVAAVREAFGLMPGAEVTTEANPDTVDAGSLEALAAGGFTRVSLGMQSAVPHVLATLDRTHDPTNVRAAVRAASAVGLGTSLDLIYGAPGESLADWRASVDAAVELGVDHVSAYALVVESGTRLAARVRRGDVAAPEDDDEADKYELADEVLSAAGWRWYEISNWARTASDACRHNLGYWRGGQWWGLGPGAHSHVGGVRWWNVRHPAAYALRLGAGMSPMQGREVLTKEQTYDELVLLRTRLAQGLPVDLLRPQGRAAVAGLIADGLVEPSPALRGDPRRVLLTRRGRLLADTVVHRLLAG